jgi:hypothetical protein
MTVLDGGGASICANNYVEMLREWFCRKFGEDAL